MEFNAGTEWTLQTGYWERGNYLSLTQARFKNYTLLQPALYW